MVSLCLLKIDLLIDLLYPNPIVEQLDFRSTLAGSALSRFDKFHGSTETHILAEDPGILSAARGDD
jgi:hypothetical protein